MDPSRLRARPETARAHAAEPEAQGRGARGAWPLHLGATRRKGCYENTLDIINRAIAWLDERSARQAPLRRPSPPQPLTIDRRREIAAAIMPAIRGLHLGAASQSAQGGPLRRQRDGARFRGRREARAACRARHLLPGSLPAHQDLAAGAALRSARDDASML